MPVPSNSSIEKIFGGNDMEFKDSKTFSNLMAAFAGESQARSKYLSLIHI